MVIPDFGDLRCINCGHRPTVGYVPPQDECMRPEREALVKDDAYNLLFSRRGPQRARGKDKQPRKTHV